MTCVETSLYPPCVLLYVVYNGYFKKKENIQEKIEKKENIDKKIKRSEKEKQIEKEPK